MKYIQEVTFKSKNSQLSLEVHVNPFNTSNEIDFKMNSYFRGSFSHTIWQDIAGVKLRTLDQTDHFLFLILHAFKHFLYSGFGVRMICDILLFMKKYESVIDFEYVNDCLKEVNAYMFYQDLIHIGNEYLGFSFKTDNASKNCDMLLDDIFDAGLFGNKGTDRTLAAVLTRTALKDAGKKDTQGGLNRALKTLFPGKEWLYATNPKIKQNPLLAVPAYLGRIKKGATFFVKGRKRSKQGVELSKRRIDLLHKYGIL